MRILLCILLCGLLVACSNANKEEMRAVESVEMEENVAEEVGSEAFTYETMTKQKLQELIELNELTQNFPADTIIKNQLKAIANDVDFSKISGLGTVVSIEALTPLTRINDSAQQIKVRYASKLGIHGETKFDTLTALFNSKTVILDRVEQIATKIVFKN